MKNLPQDFLDFKEAINQSVQKIAQEQNIIIVSDIDHEIDIALRDRSIPFLRMWELSADDLSYILFTVDIATTDNTSGITLAARNLPKPILSVEGHMFHWEEREQALKTFVEIVKADMAKNIPHSHPAPSLFY